MKFSQEFLDEELSSKDVVMNQPFEKHRWYMIHRLVFKHEGKFYEARPMEPASEIQEGQGRWATASDPVECPEVVPFEKTVTDYRPA
jgi:hypothetical protein